MYQERCSHSNILSNRRGLERHVSTVFMPHVLSMCNAALCMVQLACDISCAKSGGVSEVSHTTNSDCWPFPGEPWPQHMFGSVWLEPVHHRAWPEGGFLPLRSSSRGERGLRPAHRSLPWLCLCLLRKNWGLQRGMGNDCVLSNVCSLVGS